MTDIILNAKIAKGYDTESESEFQSLYMYLYEIVKEDKKTVAAIPKDTYFFVCKPRITRKDLARGLRSIAYKIQHRK